MNDDFMRRFNIKKKDHPLLTDTISDDLKHNLFIFFSEIYDGITDFKDNIGIITSDEKSCFCTYISKNFLIRFIAEDYNFEDFLIKIFKKTEENWYNIYKLWEVTFKFLNKSNINDIEIEDQSYKIKEIENKILDILKNENSGYTLMKGKFIPITNETEKKSITESLKNTSIIESVHGNIEKAIEHISSGNNNYSASIIESINAIEKLLKIIVGKDKNNKNNFDLYKLLDTCQNKKELNIPTELYKSIRKIYSYSSKYDIRHSKEKDIHTKENPYVSITEAKYMLVSCTAFINYLISKCAEAGIELNLDF